MMVFRLTLSILCDVVTAFGWGCIPLALHLPYQPIISALTFVAAFAWLTAAPEIRAFISKLRRGE